MSDPFAGLPHSGISLTNLSPEGVAGIVKTMESVPDEVFEKEIKAIKDAVKGKKDAREQYAKVISALKLGGRLAINILT